ncbi:MAG: protein kinase [Treponema sp.]|jgi:DNA-binding helix-hairpin-helix protein with protein kinase domain|nr:protein kinase [Treponema sp.]
MADLPRGFTIKTKGFKMVRVVDKLGEGGQGAVYQVDYAGQPMALKWYSGKNMKDPDKFYENLANNIKKGAPTTVFLWPEDITEKRGEAFGYIMPLRPPEYKDFSRFLLAQEKFASVTAMVNAALHITAGFRELHNQGYSYQDLNDGNFFVNPKTGAVLICDNDNVAEYGKNLGIGGKCRYTAPEVVLKEALPSVHTDKFSLGVVLFLLFMLNHPLEGKKAYPPCMTEALEKKIYGKEPVFIFDPTDPSNAPIPGINTNAIKRWPAFPLYIREKFIEAFSKKAMGDPSYRIIEQEWLRLFIRLRGEIYKCVGCGEVFFADAVHPTPCPQCHKSNTFTAYLKTPKYPVPIHQRTKLYQCHTEADSDDFLTLSGEVSLNKQTGGFELKNASKKTWYIIDGGVQRTLGPYELVTVQKGMSIDFGGCIAEII